jgi:hypothetical protein
MVFGGICHRNLYMISRDLILLLKEFIIKLGIWHMKQDLTKSTKVRCWHSEKSWNEELFQFGY